MAISQSENIKILLDLRCDTDDDFYDDECTSSNCEFVPFECPDICDYDGHASFFHDVDIEESNG